MNLRRPWWIYRGFDESVGGLWSNLRRPRWIYGGRRWHLRQASMPSTEAVDDICRNICSSHMPSHMLSHIPSHIPSHKCRHIFRHVFHHICRQWRYICRHICHNIVTVVTDGHICRHICMYIRTCVLYVSCRGHWIPLKRKTSKACLPAPDFLIRWSHSWSNQPTTFQLSFITDRCHSIYRINYTV